MAREIESSGALKAALLAHEPVRGMRLQNLDLNGELAAELLQTPGSLAGLVVLGGNVPDAVAHALVQRHALVFPRDPQVPINPYRAHLYSADELYAGLDEHGYRATPDARAYSWARETSGADDAYVSAMKALHDDAMRDALHEVLAGARPVGIMGGHAIRRDSSMYRRVACLAHDLAGQGHLVLTGGGPGAMEAANLGAATRNAALEAALDVLAATPSFEASIDEWARSAYVARTLIGMPSTITARDEIRSIGIPTWFYGHEPPNVFGDVIAKYFSNALREDDLLASSCHAIVVLAGAAGTVQEIFQALTPMYYASAGVRLPELILVGKEQWTRAVPVWPALTALAPGRPMARSVHLVDTPAEAAEIIRTSAKQGD